MVSFSTLITALPVLASTVCAFKAPQGHHGEYSIVKGFFKQADESTNNTAFDYHDNLGLYDSLTWSDFKQQIQDLNDNAPLNTTYKVIYYARHAEGYHNAAINYYGGDLWDCYYTKINGNGTVFWGPDAYLTQKGIDSAKNNSVLIKSLIPDGFPLPSSFYSSPFTRCADTLSITWGDIILDTGYFSPIFKESLRETIGLDTCDQRRDKAYLEDRYPLFSFEANFADEDELWTADEKETLNGKYWRARQLLDDVFTSDENTFISFTAHADIGAGLLYALGHRTFPLVTGAIIPLVVKRESRLDFVPVEAVSNITVGPSETPKTCGASLSYSDIPSDIAYGTSIVSEKGVSITTVTTVVSVTASAST